MAKKQEVPLINLLLKLRNRLLRLHKNTEKALIESDSSMLVDGRRVDVECVRDTLRPLKNLIKKCE